MSSDPVSESQYWPRHAQSGVTQLQCTKTQTAPRLYRSLRAVKVLLASLCSTLTVLAPRKEVRIGSRWGSSCCSSNPSALARERHASQLQRDARFDSFQLFLWHRPSLFFFDQMIEQEFAPASFASISECFSRELAL